MEWIVCMTHDFHAQLGMLWALVSEGPCNPQRCPLMCAGPGTVFYWSEAVTTTAALAKRPQALPAREYVRRLLAWGRTLLGDEHLFPADAGAPLPVAGTLLPHLRALLRRLARVYGHLYHTHFPDIVAARCEAQLNTSWKHFYYFVRAFDLVPERELAPLMPPAAVLAAGARA
jgi:MOB kinase activator 1